MTGYGKAVSEFRSKKISVEIKSLNSKQLDLNVKIPTVYREKELELRNRIATRLERGRVDLYITTESLEGEGNNAINVAVVKNYFQQLKNISRELGITTYDEQIFLATLRLPEVLQISNNELTADEWAVVSAAFEQAVQLFLDFRKQEGAALQNDILQRIALIQSLLSQVEPFEKQRIETIKNRMRQNLAEFVATGSLSNDRFEQELIYYLEKIDITEEKVRLTNHCQYFIKTADEPQAGKKLNFIMQEIGREINTIGSKANDSDIQKIVVQMKDEMEKVKEQLLNVL